MKDSPFEIQVGSDPDYEDLIAEVYYHGEFFLLVTREHETMRVEIQPRRDGTAWDLEVAQLRRALEHVEGRLEHLRRGE